MPRTITILLKDQLRKDLSVLDIPADYTPAQLLLDLISGRRLPFYEKYADPDTFRALRYGLRQNPHEFLSPYTTFSQLKILRGQTLYFEHIPDALRTQFGRVADRDFVINMMEQTLRDEDVQPYRRQFLLYRAVGATDSALLELLGEWYRERDQLKLELNDFGEFVSDGRPDLTNLPDEIGHLFLELVAEQYQYNSFEQFYDLLQNKVSQEYFKDYETIWKLQIIDALQKGSYQLGKQKRYAQAQAFALLAMQIDSEDEVSSVLQNLAQKYVALLDSTDPKTRLELAREIRQIDPDYGNIAADYESIIQENQQVLRQSSEATPKTVFRPNYPTTAAVTPPPGTPAYQTLSNVYTHQITLVERKPNWLQHNYYWVLGSLAILLFIFFLAVLLVR